MRARTIAAIVAAVVVTEAFLLATDTGPDVLLVAVIVVAIGLGVWANRPLSADSPRPGDASAPTDPPAPASPDLRAAALRQALGGGGSAQHHARRLREQLIAIVDDQLATAHGIDRATEPERAQQLLGPELTRLLHDPASVDRLTERRLGRLLTEAEAL
jgi:hypothetical protein